jgi:hypothetical protein
VRLTLKVTHSEVRVSVAESQTPGIGVIYYYYHHLEHGALVTSNNAHQSKGNLEK